MQCDLGLMAGERLDPGEINPAVSFLGRCIAGRVNKGIFEFASVLGAEQCRNPLESAAISTVAGRSSKLSSSLASA